MLIKLSSNLTLNRQKTLKVKKEKKIRFPKESIEIVNFHKPALNKRMNNLVAPLKELYMLNDRIKYDTYRSHYSSIEVLAINSVTTKPTW